MCALFQGILTIGIIKKLLESLRIVENAGLLLVRALLYLLHGAGWSACSLWCKLMSDRLHEILDNVGGTSDVKRLRFLVVSTSGCLDHIFA